MNASSIFHIILNFQFSKCHALIHKNLVHASSLTISSASLNITLSFRVIQEFRNELKYPHVKILKYPHVTAPSYHNTTTSIPSRYNPQQHHHVTILQYEYLNTLMLQSPNITIPPCYNTTIFKYPHVTIPKYYKTMLQYYNI